MNQIIICPDHNAAIPDFLELLGKDAIAEAEARTDPCAFRQILPYWFAGECQQIIAVDPRIKLGEAAAMGLVDYTQKVQTIHFYLIQKGLFRFVFPERRTNPTFCEVPSLTFEEIGLERMIYANFPAPLYYIQLTEKEWK